MSDSEVTRISNENMKDQRETAASPEKSSISERTCLLDSFSIHCRQENGSPALDNNTDGGKLVTDFSSSRWGVGISPGMPCSSLAASTLPTAKPPTSTVLLSPEAGLMAPGTSTSLKAGSSVPDVLTSPKAGSSVSDVLTSPKAGSSVPDAAASPKAGPSDLNDSTPPKARLSDPVACASPKSGSVLKDAHAKSPILARLLSTDAKYYTPIKTNATTTFIDATPLKAGSSTGSKLVIFSPDIRKATHNWKNQVGLARMRNSFTEAKSALEGGQIFQDKRSKPDFEQHKVRRFRTTDGKSLEVVSHVPQASSLSDIIPPSTSTSASSAVGCIPRNTGKQCFDSLRSFLPQWIFIKSVPSQEPETSSVSPAQQMLLNEAFNRRLFEDEKKMQTGSLISIDQSSPFCGAGESPSADETKQSSANEDKINLEKKVAEEDNAKSHETEDVREKRITRKK